MIICIILHGRPTGMRRLLIRSKRRVLIASDYLERALAPGRASTRQSWQGATDRDRSRPLVPCREVVSRNQNERSGCSRVDTGNWARTGRDRSRPVRKSVVWTRPYLCIFIVIRLWHFQVIGHSLGHRLHTTQHLAVIKQVHAFGDTMTCHMLWVATFN